LICLKPTLDSAQVGLGWVDVVRRVRRAPAADDLAVLDHTDNTRVDRGTPAIAVLSIATGLSALAPAQRAGGVLGMLSSLEVKVF
jgi:hypothetical protein